MDNKTRIRPSFGVQNGSVESKTRAVERQPLHYPVYIALLALAALASAPFPFIGSSTVFLLGLPLWLWWSLLWTASLAGLTAWGILRLWQDDRYE